MTSVPEPALGEAGKLAESADATEPVEATGHAEHPGLAGAIERGAEALLRRQRPDGAFGDDPPASVLGTAGTIAALAAHDPAANADLIARGAGWLREQQHADGGWGGVTGADSEVVATAVAIAGLRLADPDGADEAAGSSGAAVAAGRSCLARLGGVAAITDQAISLLCRQLLTMAGLTAEAGELRRLPLEIVFFDKVRRQRISFRTAPFVGLALMQDGLLPAPGRLRRATLAKARPKAVGLLRSIYDHEGRTGALSEDPWPAALVLLGLARSGEAPDMAAAIAGWLRRAVRPDGAWDAVTNLDLTRSGYAATGLIAAGYAADPRLAATRQLFHDRQKTEPFAVLDVPAGGWSYSNAGGWPVTLESAEILSALAELPGAEHDRALASGLDWLLGRQDKRGSWSLWVRDTKLANDGPCPAITSQAITALRDAGRPADDPAVVRAAGWLLTQQRPDGTFENLWYRDYTSGTAVVVSALCRAGHAEHEAVRRAVAWLVRTQLADGSWGPANDAVLDGAGGSVSDGAGGSVSDGAAGSVEETGWAVQALLAAGGPAEVVRRGVDWLVGNQQPDGGWQPSRIANYIRHHMRYPNAVITQAVALRALGEYRHAVGATDKAAG